MKPIIGIPTLPFRASYSDTELAALDGKELGYYWLLSRLTEKICASVSRAGGVPLLLRATNDAEEISAEAERLDGFVFTGGSDITPSLYGEENHGSISPDTERDMFEFSLMKEALPKNKPMLGITCPRQGNRSRRRARSFHRSRARRAHSRRRDTRRSPRTAGWNAR